MSRIKIMTVFGTRPEAIKMAPLCRLLSEDDDIAHVCCLTGQQRDLLPKALHFFGISGDYNLDIMEYNQSLTTITTKVLAGLDGILERERPDMLLCHGDTSTSFAAALAAFYKKIPVGHVEAGLRTYDRYSPYPEELNRQLISRLATLHFAPTARSRINLSEEGIIDGVYVTGNTVIDAIMQTVLPGYVFELPLLNSFGHHYSVILVTAHRSENYGKPLENICEAVLALSERYPHLIFVWPVHPSPVVGETVRRILGGKRNIHLLDSLETVELHQLMARCCFVMTDSGGIQEEAPALGKPVMVLRRETERPEAIEAGVAVLAGVEKDNIIEIATRLIEDNDYYDEMASSVNPYGDGHASRRILNAIMWYFKRAVHPPAEFIP